MNNLFQWVRGIKNIKVFGNKTLLEVTKYRGYAFWWFIRNLLFSDLELTLNSNKRAYTPHSPQYLTGKLDLLFCIFLLFTTFITKLITLLLPSKAETGSNKILLTGKFSSWKSVRHPKSDQLRLGYVFFDSVLQSLNKESGSFGIVACYPIAFSLFRVIRRVIQMKRSQTIGGFTPLESYFSWRTLFAVIWAKRHFGQVFSELKSNQAIPDAFVFEKINIFDNFQNYFEYYFKTYLPLMVWYFELSVRALSKEKPSLVLLTNEYGGFERALLFAAHHCNIPSLALQHGIIHKYHRGYIYFKDEISENGSPHFPNVPIPTITAVFGSYYKDILTAYSAYPSSSVKVTGQPRYDILSHAEKMYSRNKFCNKHGLNPKKTIALIITQPINPREIRDTFFLSTMQALNRFDNLQIVVKPHPGESTEWYRQQIKSIKLPSIVLSPRFDTNEAIFACDLFFTINSTTILEALILNKKIFAVNLSNLPDVLPWVQEGVVTGVYKEVELFSAIKKALSGLNDDPLFERRRIEFLRKHVYKTDGKATERVTALINQLVRKMNDSR